MERADFGTPIFVRETLDEERHMSSSNRYQVAFRNGDKSSIYEKMDDAKGFVETCYFLLPDGDLPIAIEVVSKSGDVLSSEKWERPGQD